MPFIRCLDLQVACLEYSFDMQNIDPLILIVDMYHISRYIRRTFFRLLLTLGVLAAPLFPFKSRVIFY